jgi:hypothetical protein
MSFSRVFRDTIFDRLADELYVSFKKPVFRELYEKKKIMYTFGRRNFY